MIYVVPVLQNKYIHVVSLAFSWNYETILYMYNTNAIHCVLYIPICLIFREFGSINKIHNICITCVLKDQMIHVVYPRIFISDVFKQVMVVLSNNSIDCHGYQYTHSICEEMIFICKYYLIENHEMEVNTFS